MGRGAAGTIVRERVGGRRELRAARRLESGGAACSVACAARSQRGARRLRAAPRGCCVRCSRFVSVMCGGAPKSVREGSARLARCGEFVDRDSQSSTEGPGDTGHLRGRQRGGFVVILRAIGLFETGRSLMKRNRGGRTGGLGGGTLATGSARRTRKFAERRAGGALLLVGSLALACSRDPEPEKAPEKPAGQEAQENGARRVSHAEDAKVMAEHHVAHETADGELEQMQHAFFLVGDAHPFLVHMTNMWMDAHLYQMVLRVKLPEAMWQAYVKDRESAGSEHWYIVGNVADDEMALPDLARGAKRSFR